MHKRREEIRGVSAANNFEVIIAPDAYPSIAHRKQSHNAAVAAARKESEIPDADLITLLCLALPDKTTHQNPDIRFNQVLRNFLPENTTLRRLINDSKNCMIDRVEFSCNDKKQLLPPVVSLRFTIADKASGKESTLMYRCTINSEKIDIAKVTDVKAYKNNFYESSNDAQAKHIKSPSAPQNK